MESKYRNLELVFPPTLPAARAIAVAILLGTFILGSSLPAGSTNLVQAPAAKSIQLHESLAQASESPATTEPEAETAKPDPVEARIKDLHKKLHITADQQAQWDNLTQVMRDNAKAMMDLQKERSEDASSMTAVDAIKSYAAVIEAHEVGMKKFLPAFQALYDSMSDEQKKAADTLFRNRVRSAAAKESHHGKDHASQDQ